MKSEEAQFFYEISPLINLGHEIASLTYASHVKLDAGQLVAISVGRRQAVGVVIAAVKKPTFNTKPIERQLIFDGTAAVLPSQLVQLATWMAAFYTANLTTVWSNMLPSGLLKNRRSTSITDNITEQKNYSNDKNPTKIILTADQQRTLKTLRTMSSGTAILRGVTGSGKTEIYKNLTLDAIHAQNSVLILVPEISLTTQLVNEFRNFFDGIADVLVSHSAQKETERFATWRQALANKRPIVAIGPRSALFLPLRNLGLIVIDEAHETTYIQDKAPRYDTKVVAAQLAKLADAKLILGSATPLVTDVYRATKLNRPIVEMTTLAQTGAKHAQITIVDMTNRANQHTSKPIFSSESRIFSRPLLDAMKNALAEGKQILLFHNRRGTASTTLCENCGWVATCPHCCLPLTLHADRFELRCHICGFRTKVPLKCPDCGHVDIVYKGLGTKRIEDECRRLFPEIIANDPMAIRRFDGDTSNADSVANVYDQLKSGQTRIIIGTQQIAKGLDLPLLKVVGVVQADTGLNLPDFGARERTFQLISQAIGRVGRTADDTAAIIQTYQPQAPAITFAAKQDFWGFYNAELPLRQRGHFPPFVHLLKITISYKTERSAVIKSRQITEAIRQSATDVTILGPTPAFHEQVRGDYRWQIVARSSQRSKLSAIADEITQKYPVKNVTTELDAHSLI